MLPSRPEEVSGPPSVFPPAPIGPTAAVTGMVLAHPLYRVTRGLIDSPGFGAPPPFLVPRFTLLGAGNPQHCPDQHGWRLFCGWGRVISGRKTAYLLQSTPSIAMRVATAYASQSGLCLTGDKSRSRTASRRYQAVCQPSGIEPELLWWGEMESHHREPKPTDLQSALALYKTTAPKTDIGERPGFNPLRPSRTGCSAAVHPARRSPMATASPSAPAWQITSPERLWPREGRKCRPVMTTGPICHRDETTKSCNPNNASMISSKVKCINPRGSF